MIPFVVFCSHRLPLNPWILTEMLLGEIFSSQSPTHSGWHPPRLLRCILKGDVTRLPVWSYVISLEPHDVCFPAHCTHDVNTRGFTLWWARPPTQTVTSRLLVSWNAVTTCETWKCVTSCVWMEKHILTLCYPPVMLSHPSGSSSLPVHFVHSNGRNQHLHPRGEFFF